MSTSPDSAQSTRAVKAVWKYTLEPWGTRIEMPKGARLLHVHEQGGEVCVWAEVDTAAPLVQRIVLVVGTGHMISASAQTYVGTAHLVEAGQPIVLHVYEGGEIDG